MSCKKKEKEILTMLLSQKESIEAKIHLSSCLNCRKFLEESKELFIQLENFKAPELSTDFVNEISLQMISIKRKIDIERSIVWIVLISIFSLPILLFINYFWIQLQYNILTYILPPTLIQYILIMLILEFSLFLALIYGSIPLITAKIKKMRI